MAARTSFVPHQRASRGERTLRSGLHASSLLASMLVALAVVTGLAYWDEERESEAALEDFAVEQATLASSVGAEVLGRLTTIRRDALILADDAADGRKPAAAIAASYAPLRVRPSADPLRTPPSSHVLLLSIPAGDQTVDLGIAPSTLLLNVSHVERPGELLLLLATPEGGAFQTSDGRALVAESVRGAIADGKTYLRLTRTDAADLGLPARTAIAGLARIDAGPLGRWAVVTVASASRERDRELRARWRLVLGVLVASTLVLAFGGLALRKQRAELQLARDLAVAEVAHERDERLVRAGRVAMMGTFAMGVAHEVSTPLGVIVGRAEQLVGRLTGDEKSTRGAQIILSEAERIGETVRRFLGLARGGPLSLSQVDASVIARSALAMVEHRFAKANVTLSANMADNLPAISCDRGSLEHVFVNLLLNACEACKPGGHVELTVRADARQVAFIVTDDGVGITPEDAVRATEPFFTTKPVGQGTGLGLAIANEIVKTHLGALTITPNEPRGTRVSVTIPAGSTAAPRSADRKDPAHDGD